MVWGERIVSSRCTPDTYVLLKDDLSVVEKRIARKNAGTYFSEDVSGLVEQDISVDAQEAPTLQESELIALGKLGKQIETLFGGPQDIEWAIEAGTIYIVQTRPVTVVKGIKQGG